MREIRLHDTRSGELLALQPRDPGRVGIYACGPTVYSRIHIGNARPFVVFSLMKRFLESEGLTVTLVVNVTDVNDKIYDAARPEPNSPDAARRRGRPSRDLAAEMTLHYVRDTNALGLGRPDHEPLASETIDSMIAYIQRLIDTDHAYAVEGDVFFRVRSDPGYGSLSHRRIEEMGLESHPPEDKAGSDRKEDPLDFALWKGRKEGEDTWWEAPWGQGRPGWHIECSAMAEDLLGVGFDIHGGGSDLVFPHHENEAAQTRAARGEELAKLWVHNGMIQTTGEKMAKSVGNIAPLHELLDEANDGWGRHVVVMYLIGGHYRQPLAFSRSELQDAERRVSRIRDALRRLVAGQASPPEMAGFRKAFSDALADDFNTPRALASLFEWVREANRRSEGVGDRDLREMLEILGLGDLTALEAVGDGAGVDPEAMDLLARREAARGERDFAAADRLREELSVRGWEIRDGPGGSELIPIARP